MASINDYTLTDRRYQSFKLDGDDEVARRVVKGNQNSVYDSAELAVSNGISDYDVATNQSDLWDDVPSPVFVSIRTDQTITVKFNSSSNKSITITAADSPFTLDGLLTVSNIYISNNSGSTANIKILLI